MNVNSQLMRYKISLNTSYSSKNWLEAIFIAIHLKVPRKVIVITPNFTLTV